MTAQPDANDASLALIAQAWEIEDPEAVPNLAEFIDPQLFYPPEDPFIVETMMPIASLYGSEDMDEAKLASDNRTQETEKARFEGIRRWMRQMGPEAALRAAPIIGAVDDKLRFSCADGWHRCLVAQ